MRLLNEILQLRRDIDSIAERAIELKQMTQPKAQTISDMPRGDGERKNAIEEYIIKSERLHRKFVHKKELFIAKWSEFRRIADDCGVTEAQRDVIYYRFHNALPWKLCVARMEKQYPETTWNEQKLFRIYRKVLCKIDRKSKEK